MPDYYLRYRNRVFVFGCKDVQMAAKIKLSSDYETIKNNFWEICHKFQGACERGWQLANMIGKKIPSILSEVDKWTTNGVKFIYPVIVYLDDCFDVEIPSYYWIKSFNKSLVKRKFLLSINTYFKKQERLDMSWKRYVGLMKFLRIWRCWIGKGYDEWDLLKERIWSTTLFYNLSYNCD